MAQSIWSGSLSFGLVNLPVALYSAVEEHAARFNQFEAGTSDRIRYRKINERTGEEVDFSNIVKGVEVEDGEYVILTPEELQAIEQGQTKTIEVSDFVELSAIDPIYFQRCYYIAPHGTSAPRPYSLLRGAMASSGKVAIATFVMRGRQHLAAIRPSKDVLMLETMYYADEIRDPVKEIDSLSGAVKINDKELSTAKMLIESMTTDWDPTSYQDTYGESVQKLISSKRKKATISHTSQETSPTQVLDLMDALRDSIKASESKRRKPAGRKAS